MIRWRFVVTRLVVVVAILTLIGWGLGPVARYATQRGLESVTGAKVDLADAEVGLFPPWVRLQNLEIADPRGDKAMRNAISAQSIELVVDGDALLHRRWVAKRARIEGLRVGGRRSESGHLDYEVVEPEPEPSETSALASWLEAAGGLMVQRAEDYGKNLQTVQATDKIKQQWALEYAQLAEDAKQLEEQVRSIRDRVSLIRNPLREYEALRRTQQEAVSIRDRASQLRFKLSSLPQQLQTDLASLDAAKKADVEALDRWVPIDLSNTENLSKELIEQTLRDQVAKIRGYMDNLSTVAGATVVSPEATGRVRGKNYQLVDDAPPTWMVRQCAVSGLLRQGGDDYALTGKIENLTPTPELLSQPTAARLKLEGPDVIIANLVSDRRAGAERDVVKLHWPNLQSGSMQLGNDDHASIRMEGGHRELWVQISNDRGQIEGRLICKQSGVQTELRTSPELAKLAAIKSLSESVSKLDRVEIAADFSGTWDQFELRHQSNLGAALREATRSAVNAQVAQTKTKLYDEIDRVHADQVKELQAWAAEQQGKANSLLAKADGTIEDLFEKIVKAVDSDGVYIGRAEEAIRGLLK